MLSQQGWTVRALCGALQEQRREATFGNRKLRAASNTSKEIYLQVPHGRSRLFTECLKGANALIHIGEAKTKEKDFDAKNIKTFGLLLEAANAMSSLDRFIFVSAFMAGGLPHPMPKILTEEMTGTEFPDPYFQWKRMAERLLINPPAIPVLATPSSGRH